MRQLTKLLYCAIPMLVLIGIQICILVVFGLGYYDRPVGDDDLLRGFMIPEKRLYLISVIAVFVSGVVFIFWYRHLTKYKIRTPFHRLISWKLIIWIVLLGVGAQFLVSGLLRIILSLNQQLYNQYANTIENLTQGHPLLVMLLVVIIAPIAEEVIFRGVILYIIRKDFMFVVANMVQSLLFGLYHGNAIQGIYAFLLGLLLGYLYYKFDTIYIPILLHMVINTSSYIIGVLKDHIYINLLLIAVGGLMSFIMLMILKNFHIVQED